MTTKVITRLAMTIAMRVLKPMLATITAMLIMALMTAKRWTCECDVTHDGNYTMGTVPTTAMEMLLTMITEITMPMAVRMRLR